MIAHVRTREYTHAWLQSHAPRTNVSRARTAATRSAQAARRQHDAATVKRDRTAPNAAAGMATEAELDYEAGPVRSVRQRRDVVDLWRAHRVPRNWLVERLGPGRAGAPLRSPYVGIRAIAPRSRGGTATRATTGSRRRGQPDAARKLPIHGTAVPAIGPLSRPRRIRRARRQSGNLVWLPSSCRVWLLFGAM